jgi:hypothetical protein
MKKRLLKGATLLCVFALIAVSHAVAQENFIIELNNGRELVVEDYWEDNGTISFDYSGGFIQMPKSMVAGIRPTSAATLAPLQRTTPAPSAPTATDSSQAAAGPAQASADPSAESTGPAAPATASAPEDLLIQEFRTFEQRYEGRFNMNRAELEGLVTDMTRWRDKVLAARVAPFYRDELIKIYDMSEELETLHASTF